MDWADSETSHKGKTLVLDLEATTRGGDSLTVFTTNARLEILLEIAVDWKARLLDDDGNPLYTTTWTTRPSKGLSLKYSIDALPYGLLQRSAHDNFAREFLGRLGLTAGPEQLEWSN